MSDDIRIVRTGMGERFHEFLQADGRWQRCGGKGRCRECIREALRRKALRRPT